MIGSLYVSLMGHDKGRIYVITKINDAEFVDVCDGVVRKLANAKRKRIKHLKLVARDNALVSSISSSTVNDEEIRKLIQILTK